VSSSLSNANTSLTSCRTVTPAWLYSVCLVRRILSLFGNGRDPIPSNVFLPITIVWFNVFSLKYFRSFGRCQGNVPPFPMIPLSSSAHNNAIILCFAAQPSQRLSRLRMRSKKRPNGPTWSRRNGRRSRTTLPNLRKKGQTLQSAMAEIASDFEKLTQLQQELDDAEAALAEKWERWEYLSQFAKD